MANEDHKESCIIIGDDFPGFAVDTFCISPRYYGYLDYVLIPNGMIKDRLEKMSIDVVSTFENDNASSITLLCVLKGGFKFLADLVDGLERTVRTRGIVMPMSVDFVRVKSYVNDVSFHEPILTGVDDPSNYKNKDILIVEDIIDTGKTMHSLLEYLGTFSPRSIRVASLLVKRTPGCTGFRPNFTGFEVPDRFVVGYALDFNEHFRDLNHICVINEAGQEKFSVPCFK